MGGEWLETPVYDFDALAPGQEIAGPAIVESETTTVVLRPLDVATTTPFRWAGYQSWARGRLTVGHRQQHKPKR